MTNPEIHNPTLDTTVNLMEALLGDVEPLVIEEAGLRNPALHQNIRRLIPDLPELVEWHVDDGYHNVPPTSLIRKLLERTGVRRVERLSDDFTCEEYEATFRKDYGGPRVNDLRLIKRSYTGSVIVGKKEYEFPPNGSVYNILLTSWLDIHERPELAADIVHATGEVLAHDLAHGYPYNPIALQPNEEQAYLEKVNEALSGFSSN